VNRSPRPVNAPPRPRRVGPGRRMAAVDQWRWDTRPSGLREWPWSVPGAGVMGWGWGGCPFSGGDGWFVV